MKNVFRIMIIAAVATFFALPAYAQDAAAATASQDDEKNRIYTEFVGLIGKGPAEQKRASELGREYLSKFGTPEDDIVKYVRTWLEKYDKAVADFEFSQSIQNKNYARTFELGRGMLTAQPDNLNVVLKLAYAGYQSAASGNKSLNPEAIRVTRQAIQLIESGKAPDKWEAPFTSRDEALGFLHYSHGYLARESSPAEAAAAFVKVAQTNSTFKSHPSTFAYIANIYETTELKKLVDEYNAAFPAGKEVPEDQKARYEQMLAQIAQVQDRIIDAYARAVVAAGNDPKLANDKKGALARLTAYYKLRNNDSEAGLNEYLAGVPSRPTTVVALSVIGE